MFISHWQYSLNQAQMLAAKMPSTGLSPDKLALLPLDHLIGTLVYLKRLDTQDRLG